MGLGDRERQRVVAGVAALGAGEVLRPRLQGRRPERVGGRANLHHDGVVVLRDGQVVVRDELGLLRGGREAGSARPVDVGHRRDPDAPQVGLVGVRVQHAGRAARQGAQAGGVRSGGGPGQGESGGGSAEDGTTGRLHDSSTLRQSVANKLRGRGSPSATTRPVCGSRQSVPASNIERSWASSTPTTSVSSGSDPAAIADAPPASSSPMSAAVWPPASWPWAAYSSSLDAGVGDVEVAHGELTDPVDRPERGVLGALHGQLLRVVREVRAARVDERVVVAAPQPQRHLAGHRARDPALQRLTQHQRLRDRATGPRRAGGRGGGPPGGSWRWCPRCGSR